MGDIPQYHPLYSQNNIIVPSPTMIVGDIQNDCGYLQIYRFSVYIAVHLPVHLAYTEHIGELAAHFSSTLSVQ